jgi:D-arabinose 1-dehydrogenase-like Zn-dependent alcohol dehydrogenase
MEDMQSTLLEVQIILSKFQMDWMTLKSSLCLNYTTAYLMMTRVANLQKGFKEVVLVTGANGGVGAALLELLKLMEIKTYGLCSRKHFEFVEKYGAIPLVRLMSLFRSLNLKELMCYLMFSEELLPQEDTYLGL